ncbi:MAG: vWA domain-containing protein [Rhizobiaceae bacterium]
MAAKPELSVSKAMETDESRQLAEAEAPPPESALLAPAEEKKPNNALARLQNEGQSIARREVRGRVSTVFSAAKPTAPGIGFADGVAQDSIVAPIPQPVEVDRENYTDFDDNAVKSVSKVPVSTFSIDVDTAAYSRVRRALAGGSLPPKDMVRVEEMVNYFSYDYPLPETREQPFKPTVTIMPAPWNETTQLMHIGIKGFDVPQSTQPKANLVFLLDVSGSMRSADKLPLLIKSFRLLLKKLNPEDTVSIVTYAGRSATVLEPTKASDRNKIIAALENLRAGGSTAGAQGIEQAYKLAQQNFVDGGVNRVMLATDGDFNVGISDPRQLKDFIARKRKSGIFLSVFGFGTGNYNDALMQSLAQNGNGTAAYIDTLLEARKALVEEAGGTLFPIATDVKIQMEFNPARIAEYRLIGYETRALKREDFNNDKIDAGDIGSGHTVTAIYELTPVGSDAVLNTPLRYKKKPEEAAAVNVSDELGFLKMRYKLPSESKSKLIETPITGTLAVDAFEAASQDARFSVAVAGFGQKLRGNDALDGWGWDAIAKAAKDASGGDLFGYRNEFAQLVRLAGALSPDAKSVSAPKE